MKLAIISMLRCLYSEENSGARDVLEEFQEKMSAQGGPSRLSRNRAREAAILISRFMTGKEKQSQ